MAWRIVVPLRLSDAKTRLSAQPAPRRRELAVAMARDVVTAAQNCDACAEVVLVADAEGLEAMLHHARGLTPVMDPGEGLNAAVLAGAAGASGPVAAVLADVPCTTPRTLALALAACAEDGGFVCDAEGVGTTIVAAARLEDLRPRFGPRSRAAHASEGIPEIVDPVPGSLAGLRRDVDSEVDLWDARRLGVGAFTRAIVG
jgi:2-phospho-L-lactate guanylyltransferase